MTIRFKTAAKFLRILCAVLLLSLGFAHQPLQAAPADSRSEIYRLPDGTFADICSDGDQTRGEHGRLPFAKPYCEVCRLSASVAMPPPDDEAWLIGESAALGNAPRSFFVLAGSSAGERPKSRAPPFLS